MTTQPLAKGITTIEGQLATVISVAEGLFAAFDPSKLPPKEAGILVTINSGLLVAQRGLVKLQALRVPSSLSDVEQNLTEIAVQDQAATIKQQEPGTPAEHLVVGLNPSEGTL